MPWRLLVPFKAFVNAQTANGADYLFLHVSGSKHACQYSALHARSDIQESIREAGAKLDRKKLILECRACFLPSAWIATERNQFEAAVI